MDKQVQKLKDQFGELAEAVNAFRSQEVQIRVIDWLLTVVNADKPGKNRPYECPENSQSLKPKRPGATKILNQLLLTDFFDTPHLIAEIVEHGNELFNTELKATDVSGVLVHLVKTQRLKRERTENHRGFQYSKP